MNPYEGPINIYPPKNKIKNLLQSYTILGTVSILEHPKFDILSVLINRFIDCRNDASEGFIHSSLVFLPIVWSCLVIDTVICVLCWFYYITL